MGFNFTERNNKTLGGLLNLLLIKAVIIKKKK